MKKISLFDAFWVLPIALIIGGFLGIFFDPSLGILIGGYIFINELRAEQLKDTIKEYDNRIKSLEDGK